MLLPVAQFFGVIVVRGAGVVVAPVAQRLTTPEPMPECERGKWPGFNYGFAALRARDHLRWRYRPEDIHESGRLRPRQQSTIVVKGSLLLLTEAQPPCQARTPARLN